ncbi:hypothetical protein FRC09_018112 [Ceratobasidium sp. 395]|nr:hypothetical protein FRC09_018112 [Ceratobasidium sp. 395]
MSKRPRQVESSGSSKNQQAPGKKLRTTNSGSSSEPGKAPIASALAPPTTRDSEYYYEDGSVILLIENVLFKVHASIIKARSEVFRILLASLSDPSNEQPTGATNEHPIIISGVSAREFRSLMKFFYCLPSAKFSLFVQENERPISVWSTFIFISDIVRLSNRFRMADVENWAAQQLRTLMQTSAGQIATGVRTYVGDNMPASFPRILQHVIAISDTCLEHNIRNFLQCFCTLPQPLPPGTLLGLLRPILRTRQEDPVWFGFLFLTLLNLGHNIWKQKEFTPENRIALFSAQSYLTPLPEPLREGLNTPLLVWPIYKQGGYLETFGDKACSQKCQRQLSKAWKDVFDTSYYHAITSSEAMKPTTQLGQLPHLRLKFANSVRASTACEGDCGSKILRQLDVDISQVFLRLASYYQGID